MGDRAMSQASAALRNKLHPSKFPEMSGLMAAIVAHVIGGGWDDVEISPGIAELNATSDGFVLARRDDDIGFNEFLGTIGQFIDNFDRLAVAAELTEDEAAEFRRLREEKCASTRMRSTPSPG
jgi:hypothetical protein